jgi:transcriptional regulator
MYVPPAFKEEDESKLFELIERHSFGLLISQHDGQAFATHLPLLVDRGTGPKISLIGHMARANPQWQQAEGQTVMAVFSGPHAYISPTWYEAGNVVPTWNYVAVHVYGTFRAVADEQSTIQILQNTVRLYESPMPSPWTFDPDSEFNRRMIKAIVAFKIEISRIEGKLKMNQNQSRERRERVARALRATGDPTQAEVAKMVAETLK